MTTTVGFNGRFLAAPQTGVQRVATNLISALDERRAARGEAGGWEVIAPRAAAHRLELSTIGWREDLPLKGQAWEQLMLPLAARGAGLVNLCNMGPLTTDSAVTLIHDAQVYLTPQSYSKAFVAWYRFALPRLAARSRRVVTVSEFSRAQLVRYGVAPAEKIVVVHNGADHMLATAAEPAVLERLALAGADYCVAFGSLQKHKNLEMLLKVFADKRLADLTLVVMGSLDAAQLEGAFGFALSPNVRLTGRLSDGELRSLIEGAVALLSPSSTEGFGLPALEAMLLGCPTIAAPAGALPEVCGEAALYAPIADPSAWVAQIELLAGDLSGRPERRRRAVEHAQAFRWARSAEQFEAVLCAAVG